MEQTKELVSKSPKRWGPFYAIFGSVGIYLVSQIILIVPIIIISVINPGQDTQDVINNSVGVSLLLTLVSSLSVLLLLYYLLKRRGQSFKDLGFKSFKIKDCLWIFLGLVMYFGALIVTLTILSLIPSFDAEQTQTIGYQGAAGWQLILVFIGLVTLPPITEEMLFRGFLYRGLSSKWPKIISALIASALFALVHFQWNVGVDVFILSLILILILEKTKNLWSCIILHALKNGIAFLALFVFT
jgi:membrane protease YdiL (CAAX protease family)